MIYLSVLEGLKKSIISINGAGPVLTKIGSACFVLLELSYLCKAVEKACIGIKKQSKKICLDVQSQDISNSDVIMGDPVWNTVLFFPDMFPENENSTTNKLIWYLNQAQLTIQICIFSMAFGMLERALTNIKKKGVIIEVVAHNPATARRLFRKGINVKVWKQTFPSTHYPGVNIDLMHHKFFIIDGKALINGSLNLTRDGVARNHENIVITNNRRAVDSFIDEFSNLWFKSEVVVTSTDLRKVSIDDFVINGIRTRSIMTEE